ncbi:hypothetical protein Q5P01_021862 [Channa striata]|uniref:Ig-like domain-containing protein n=1 Tax=Channa striata TaxID=64152 RepID=A0AA88LUW8_CHASR|nr:hypothetical protein Q5P01_021862 [Channa striata]
MSPPETVQGLTSILWKFNGNLVAEWVKDKVPLEYYSQFKGRTTLNTGDGLLTISSMTAADAGRYTVETNNKVQTVGYNAKVLNKVPKPTVEVQPLGCNPTSPDCYLTCNGNTTGAEPVTYSWKKDDKDWQSSEKRINIINNEEMQRVKTFICRMNNSVSQEDSDPIDNLFFQEKQPESSPGVGVGLGVVSFLLLIIGSVFLYCKKDELKSKFQSRNARNQAKNVDKDHDKKTDKHSPGENENFCLNTRPEQ